MVDVRHAGRNVGITQLAFYRAWLQGLGLREAADLYLGEGLDLRQARSTLTWLHDTLRQAATRHGHHGEARLLRLRLAENRSTMVQSVTPSIDDFREEVDPTGFYSHAELMDQYRERYPDDPKQKKRARLLERQVATLSWLEGLLVTAPVRRDPVSAWLDPPIAARLGHSGLATLGDVMARIQTRGFHWYRDVPRLGVRGAARLVAWLSAHEGTLGVLPIWSQKPPKDLVAGDRQHERVVLGSETARPAPLEALVLETLSRPAMATPAHGAVLIQAEDDGQAIAAWLDSHTGSPATRRAYRREAERVLLWGRLERGIDLVAFGAEDATAYRDWIRSLGRTSIADWSYRLPQEAWFAPRHTPRQSAEWRPFEGALAPASIHFALTAVRALFSWLATVRYRDVSPWPLVDVSRLSTDQQAAVRTNRTIPGDLWDVLVAAADSLPTAREVARGRLLLALSRIAGLHRMELAEARYGCVSTMPLVEGGGMNTLLHVQGKGERWRTVQLSEAVLSLMAADRNVRGLPVSLADTLPDTPVLARPDGKALKPGGLAKVVKRLYGVAARRLQDAGRTADAAILLDASTHWLRATNPP